METVSSFVGHLRTRLLVGFGVVGLAMCPGYGAPREQSLPRIAFDVPAADATISLRRFAEQAMQEVIYPPDRVKGEKTTAIKGTYTAREAIDRLLAGTALRATQAKNGAIAINRVEPTGDRLTEFQKKP
ncbi:MAG: secretin and TonB N-terminal domain-containing protein [Opitutae bacterium]|nr:secretin and TonB N-terminal domain-containing protein [Opitutae bacterium]